MFSGIVSGIGSVKSIKHKNDIISIEVKAPKNFSKKLKKGASVSVDGVCLTAINSDSDTIKFDVIEETLSRTTIGNFVKGQKVNLERSMTASSEIGGHLISGHIHCVSEIISINEKKSSKDMKISIPKGMDKYILEKGYIGVNGCSLTVGKVFKTNFNIHLIPETLKVTNLDLLKEKSLVNIELDQNTVTIVDSVEKILNR
jgi:riboflavin synthase|tara:strand:+ start:4504 stop:5106 length:603 start_codon:yes stop_codon:yes gene_type:complete